MIPDITIQKLINELDASCVGIHLFKGDHSAFHKEVQKCTDEVLKKYGLLYRTWEITFYKGHLYTAILHYNRVFEMDRRTNGDKGHFSQVTFACKENINTNSSIAQLLAHIRRNEINKLIDGLDTELQGSIKNVETCTEKISALKLELENL